MTDDDIRTTIRRAIMEITGTDTLPGMTPATPLSDLGLDSLDTAEAVLWIEDELRIEIATDFEPVTVGGLTTAIRAALGPVPLGAEA